MERDVWIQYQQTIQQREISTSNNIMTTTGIQKQALGVIFHFRSFVLKQEWARYVWSIGFSTSSLSSSFQGFRFITLSKKVISCKKVKQIKNQANLPDCETEASFSDGPKSCGLPLHFRCCTFYSSMHSEFLLVQALVRVSHSRLPFFCISMLTHRYIKPWYLVLSMEIRLVTSNTSLLFHKSLKLLFLMIWECLKQAVTNSIGLALVLLFFCPFCW